MKVLIVDDEPLIRWALAETLEHAGHQIEETESAHETIERLSSGYEPDLVLLDFRLPDSNDLDLLRAIRRLSPASGVVMMTAFGSEDMVAEAERLGVYAVVDKPIAIDDLPSLVERAHHAHRQTH